MKRISKPRVAVDAIGFRESAKLLGITQRELRELLKKDESQWPADVLEALKAANKRCMAGGVQRIVLEGAQRIAAGEGKGRKS